MIKSGAFNNIPSIQALSQYHPIIIEGMGYYDPRDPQVVANHIVDQLQLHWSSHHYQQQHEQEQDAIDKLPNHCRFQDAANNNNNNIQDKPKLVVVQGDPWSERGISAITPLVAHALSLKRGLVYLDPEIADYHSPNADRSNVILEIPYSEMTGILTETMIQPNIMDTIESAVDALLETKNQQRKTLDKPPLKPYFRDFALLQEVTKAACLQICGDLTIAHSTAKTISEFSVTSFYQVGLDLGLYTKDHMVSYDLWDELDFERIDKR